jgi:ABC-type branched-subunit amino acid transport system substrate-binding protein
MKRRSLLRLLAASPAGLLGPAAFAQKNAGGAAPIVLGQSAAFTGPAAQLGIQLNHGARLCFDQLNARGGINGSPIELRTLDDGYEPDRCLANTQRFVDEDVFALFGYVGTPTSVKALPVVRESHIPFFAPFSGAMALRDPMLKNVFHVRASYDDETALMVRQLTALDLKRIAVFRQNDAYGLAGLNGVNKALAEHALQPVAVATVERNSVDVDKAVKALIAARPDVVVQISAYKSCAAFVREARKAGYGGAFYNVSFVGTQALSDELGRDALGVVVSQVVPYPFSSTVPIVREYLDAIQAAGGTHRPNYSSLEGYIDARVFVEGLRRGKTISREGLQGGLESMSRVDFGGMMLNFGPRDHVASHFCELTMLTDNGKVMR